MTNHDHDAPADHDLHGDASTETRSALGLGCYLSATDRDIGHSLVIELVGREPQPDPEVQHLYQ